MAGLLRPEKRKPPPSLLGRKATENRGTTSVLARGRALSGPCRPLRCKRRTVGPLLGKDRFTAGLGEVFTGAAAAFSHLPKALLRRTCPGYLVPSLPMVVL